MSVRRGNRGQVISRSSLLSFLLLAGCGFGTAAITAGLAGDGGSDSVSQAGVAHRLIRDPTIGSVVPIGGQLVVAELPAAAPVRFDEGANYDAVWLDSVGQIRGTTRVRGMDPTRIAFVVPLRLGSGDYTVEFPLGGGRASVPVPVGQDPVVADPAAQLAAARSWWRGQLDRLVVKAQAETDADRRARSLADLSRASGWLSQFEGAVEGLDGDSVQTLALCLVANEVLRPADLWAPFVSVDILAARCASAATTAAHGIAALAASGSVLAPEGSSPLLRPLLEASMKIGGLVGVLSAYDGWAEALVSPCRPSDGTLMVTSAAGGLLRIHLLQPLGLRCLVPCSSLVAADVVRDVRVAAIAGALSALAARYASLFVSLQQEVDSRIPSMPTQSVRGDVELDPARLEIVSQPASALPLVGIAAGRLRADITLGASGSVQLGLRLRESELGEASGVFLVQLDDSVPAGADLVRIAPGTFSMGMVGTNGLPVHSVTITRPFWIGRTEVTQAQYTSLMGDHPQVWPDPDRPVELVDWHDAREYCRRLTSAEGAAGRIPYGFQYRLPTEAEWEYCCRAGTSTEWSVGNSLSCSQANFALMTQVEYCVLPGQTSPVGSYPANSFGLVDMHGNVWEWCLDAWDGTSAYPDAPVFDPHVEVGVARILRGGSWFDERTYCRSAWRAAILPSDPGTARNVGFRVVCGPILP